MMKLLLAFVLAGLFLLCAAYSILAYYRLVAIAKGIQPYGWIRSRNFFHPKAECSISRASNTLPLGSTTTTRFFDLSNPIRQNHSSDQLF
jgi:hypothetical protein